MLSQLSSTEVDTLIKLAKAFTTVDENGDALLGDDGLIHLPQQAFNTDLIAYNNGNLVDAGGLQLNARNNVLFSPDLGNGIEISGVASNVISPVAGAYLGPTNANSDASTAVTLTANRIYASHFTLPKAMTINSAGPLTWTAGVSTITTGIYTDVDGTPGKRIASVTVTSTGAGTFPATGLGLNLLSGNYWVLMQPTLAAANMRGVTAAGLGGRSGYVIGAGNDLRSILGIYRDPVSGGLLEDETNSTWTATFNGGAAFPFMIMGA